MKVRWGDTFWTPQVAPNDRPRLVHVIAFKPLSVVGDLYNAEYVFSHRRIKR